MKYYIITLTHNTYGQRLTNLVSWDLRHMLLFGWCNVQSEAAAAGHAEGLANEKWGKQTNIDLFITYALPAQ